MLYVSDLPGLLLEHSVEKALEGGSLYTRGASSQVSILRQLDSVYSEGR